MEGEKEEDRKAVTALGQKGLIPRTIIVLPPRDLGNDV